MREYELITIFNTTANTLEEAKGKLQEILKRHNVRPSREEDWGERKLHHDIHKIKTGHFLHQTCRIEPRAIAELKRELQLEQGILRFMLKRVEKAA